MDILVNNAGTIARSPAAQHTDADWDRVLQVDLDFAGVAVFLASRASDYVHGALIPVDGGWLDR
ncbi:MAG TPA: hypothetical protein VFI65_19625 [Streptosporangiaceae bacterium]|nr:hypothetical protein [Streptosporangiaceae bacterium]